MATYRERREARADRLEGWAEKREVRGDAAFDCSREMLDQIPFGQPILAGHHSQGRDTRYRARAGSLMDRAVADGRKADEMRAKAENIRSAADRAIYSDDPDAVEALTVKLAGLEAQRARIKAFNVSCRKGAPDLELLDERQRRNLDACRRAGQLKPNGAFPGYATSNLSGVIASTRKRLVELSR